MADPPRIGKYELLRVVGSGSAGTVFAARDSLIGRKVAIKLLEAELAREREPRERFLREAQAAGALQHPNIVKVYDVGDSAGQPFIAMEFVEGDDLERILHEVKLPLERRLDLLRQICEGLDHAHARGIVHRDVKPSNIRVTAAGEVKIMDFGIARLQAAADLTRRGRMMGSVHYVSPEQVEGREADARADVFSVGAIAFELLSGKKPFAAATVSGVMARVAYGSPDLDLLPTTAYSPGLEVMVANALARRPADRYQSLADMREDLRQVVAETAAKFS